MKIVSAVLGLALVFLAAGCFEQTNGPRSYAGPLLRYHFAGRANLPAGTNAARFKEIDAMPATAQLRSQLAQKLAAAALPFWRKDLPVDATDQTALLKPLIEDLITAEAFVEVRGAAGSTDTALAVFLSDDRAQLWDKSVRQLMAAWKLGAPRELTTQGFKGWEVKKSQAPDVFQFFRAGKWVVLGLGHRQLTQLPALLTEAAKSGRPVPALKETFLDVAADLPNLRAWFPILSQWPLPPVLATVAGRGDGVRTEVRLQYSGKVPWKFEPWKIPTNVISEPLTSFTIGQGLAPFLRQVKGLADLGFSPLPNQFCAWGTHHEQCQLYFAVPVADATNTMHKLSTGVPKYTYSLVTNLWGTFLYSTNRSDLKLSGVPPWISPMMHPVIDGKDQYIFGGISPLAPKPTPVPDELFAQVRGRTNLLYYDWEITQYRLLHSHQLYQLTSIVTGRRTASTNSISQRWLSAIGPKLGNTATEITQVSPQELVLVRRSHLGFTGFELETLAMWLDTPGFPFDFRLPPPVPRVKTNSASGKTAATKAAPNSLPAKTGTNPPATKR